jgi:hypothetical protein
MRRTQASVLIGSLVILVGVVAASPARAGNSFIGPFNKIDVISSTVPSNGDLNPYGVAVVPSSVGTLVRGDVLVSNFNNSSNLQGTGTTIVQVDPNTMMAHLFAQIDPAHLPGPCPGGVGLTTALGVLARGWVIVGSLPTSDGMSDTAKAGCLLVLDGNGKVRETISGRSINGPWDMATVDMGRKAVLFVTNVLNGTVQGGGKVVNRGTVLRIALAVHREKPPTVQAERIIGSGFGERTDPSALVVGPTGLALGHGDVLFVADTVANRIAAIPDALHRQSSAFTGLDVTENGALNGPLGLTLAPNGDILTVNAGDGNIVETTPGGDQIDMKTLDSTGTPPGAGTLFGLAVVPGGLGVYFVDDGSNTLNILH